jgi:peptidoglycan/LPS O-acetylase OafA/YrhL
MTNHAPIVNHKIQSIQIIRAISIALVLLFHMGLPVDSGFLGVDIFFFVSGYIVTKMLVEKYHGKNIPINKFYTNRFYRLYPALIFSIFLTVALSIALQSSNEILEIIKYAVHSLVGISNFTYYLNSSIYGTSSTDNNPLLHLWSLSVEFQFYLVFPIVLLFLLRYFKDKTFKIIATITTISIILTLILSLNSSLLSGIANPNMLMFYLLPFRIYEFLIGSLTYFLIIRYRVIWDNLAKFSMFFFILASGVLLWTTSFSDQSKVLRSLLLMMCLSGIIIFSQAMPTSNKLLMRVLEKLGGYAYSIYLIHLPLITLFHIRYPNNELIPVFMGLVAIITGVLVSELIEFPQMIKRSKFVIVSLFSVVFLLVFLNYAFASYNSKNGVGEVFTEKSAQYFREGGCIDSTLIGDELCEWNSNFDNSIIVVGDSQATFALDGIIPAAYDTGFKVMSAARQGCPFMDNSIFNDPNEKCFVIREKAWQYIESIKPDFVIISNLSTGYLKSSRSTLSSNGEKCPDINGFGCNGYKNGLEKTIKKLESLKIKVILIQTIPNFTGEFNRNFFDFDPKINTSRDKLFKTREPTAFIEESFEKSSDLKLVDPFEYLCNSKICPLTQNGEYLYANEFHLSTLGAQRLTSPLKQILSARE